MPIIQVERKQIRTQIKAAIETDVQETIAGLLPVQRRYQRPGGLGRLEVPI